MTEEQHHSDGMGWTYLEARARQSRAGLHMTAEERLTWLEEMLDELLPLVGRAQPEEKRRTKTRDNQS